MITEKGSSRKEQNIKKVIEWIKNDQFEYGEWGRSELGEGRERTLEESKEHPHVFSSIYAMNTLRILDTENYEDCEVRMCEWQEKLRNEKGYWESKTVKRSPIGEELEGQINRRHTVKGLDYYLQTDHFSIAQDNAVLLEVLELQDEHGGFSQYGDSKPEIWGTAYFVNFTIGLQNDKYISYLKKRDEKKEETKYRLESKTKSAIAWILQNRNIYGIWGAKPEEYESTTFGVLVQIGPWLVKNLPKDYCAILGSINKTLCKIKRKYTWQFLLMLGIYLYKEDDQAKILKKIRSDAEDFESIKKVDLIEVLAYGWVEYFKDEPGVLQYMNELNNGHELIMPVTLREQSDSDIKQKYFFWCIEQYKQYVENNKKIDGSAVIGKAKLWTFCYDLIQKFKMNIEEKGGDELLWEKDGRPKGETGVQKVFWNYADAALENRDKVAIRERDTGRGRVDFTFSNGENETVLVEFKLLDNPLLKNGAAMVQIEQYLKSTELDTAYLVIFGFDDRKLQDKLNKVQTEIKKFRMKNPDMFIEMLYIDASRKQSASKLKACE